MSGDVTVDIEPDQTTGITTDHRPLGHSNNSQVTGAHDQPVTVTVSVPVSSSSTTTNRPIVSWLNRSVNNLQSAVLDGNVFLSNSRSAPEILTTNVRAYLGPTSEVYSLRTPESSRAEEQHSITINNENDTTTPPGIDSAEDDNGEENAEENNNPDGDNNMLIDRRGIIRMSIKESMRNISFILILLLKFVYDNFQGLFVFVSLFSIFYHVNKETGSRIAFHTNLSIKRVFLTSFSIAGCIFFILFVSGYEQHHGTLIFLPPTYEKITLWQLFWIISMSDLLIKFVTVSIKIYIACLLRHVMTFSGRAKTYSLVEQLSRLYRSLVPVLPWIFYLMNSYEGYRRLYGVFLCVLYMFAKIEYLYRKISTFTKCLKDIFCHEDICTSSNAEQVQNSDNICSICHDKYKSPVTMICSHIFCDSCISRWLNKSKTCPLCRTPIINDFHWRSGFTSICLQIW